MPGMAITYALIQRVEKVAEAGVSRASFGNLAAEFCSSPGLQVSDRARIVAKAEVSRLLCRQGNVVGLGLTEKVSGCRVIGSLHFLKQPG